MWVQFLYDNACMTVLFVLFGGAVITGVIQALRGQTQVVIKHCKHCPHCQKDEE